MISGTRKHICRLTVRQESGRQGLISSRCAIPLFLVLIGAALSPLTCAQTEDSPNVLPASVQNSGSTGPEPSEPQDAPPQNSAQTATRCGISHIGQCLKGLAHDQTVRWCLAERRSHVPRTGMVRCHRCPQNTAAK